MTELRKTPFYEPLAAAGGRFIDFFGWKMPVQFEGIIEEHKHVREKVGVFDVSHMGEIVLQGPRALEAIDKLVVNDVAALEDGQALYTPVCQPDGGIVDDVIVYRRAVDDIFVCVNASNADKDFRWFHDNVSDMCEVINRSDDYGQLALQGPAAPEVLAAALPEEGPEIAAFAPFRHRTINFEGHDVLVSTTGYTGEKGFELYIPNPVALKVWERLAAAGEAFDFKPIGLGARDTLRLEMKFCLYGNDIDETTNPLEAGLNWTVKLDKADFIGKDAILRQKEEGLKRKLVGIKMIDRGIPRPGYVLFAGDDPELQVGRVVSGTQSPTLGEAIALAYIDVPHHKRGKGRELLVDIRGRKRRAKVVKTPFLKK